MKESGTVENRQFGSKKYSTVAERDIAMAVLAMGPPESRRWPPKGHRGSAAPRQNITIVIQFTNG